MMKVRKEVEELDPYVPGRSKEEIAQEFGVKKEDIIKLGSNENPWGPSPKVKEAIEGENVEVIYSTFDELSPQERQNARLFFASSSIMLSVTVPGVTTRITSLVTIPFA